MGVWVDTDFGFDDLWALLVLHAQNVDVDGLSLVAGNTSLDQVIRNALGAKLALKTRWPLSKGAAMPLSRRPETAERILGPTGMPSQGHSLPAAPHEDLPAFEHEMQLWLNSDLPRHEILALGPLTNLAHLLRAAPSAFAKISRITWMGGSAGRGNHSPHAEFNALADPEAAALVLASGVPVDVVDLQACRQVTFSQDDIPKNMPPLWADLLGGYLDIAISRGRDRMAIYDPLAALALSCPEKMYFIPVEVTIDLSATDTYAKTTFSPATTASNIRLALHPAFEAAQLCLAAFKPYLIRKTSDA